MPSRPPRAGTSPRRAFLKLAALAPAAVAGCAAVRPGPAASTPAPPPSPPEQLEALRGFPLPADAEPALVFRARGARGRGP